MKAYYGSRFSPNMTMTPEGFLICHNVPIARTGVYEYLGKELGLDYKVNEIVKVYRSPEEVFNKKAMASFEGKIITDEHPPDLLVPENAQRYAKGTIQNVRQSKDETDLLLADLVIYDNKLIKEIKDGKREVSCGYDCVYIDNENGTYSQTEICGNHVAVVTAGRAGNRVAIKDSKEMKGDRNMSKKIRIPKKHSTTTKFLAALGLKHFAMDAEPEDIADVVEDMSSENKEQNQDDNSSEEKENVSKDEDIQDVGNPELSELKQQVSQLTEMVGKLIQTKEKNPEDAIDELINKLDTPDKTEDDEESSETIEMDEEPDSVEDEESEESTINKDSIAMVKALKAIKPVIAGISDVNQRKKACDSLIAEFKKVTKSSKQANSYSKIVKAQRKKAADNSLKRKRKSEDERLKYNENLGEEIAKKYNANLRGGK
ncbi:hypothetical protein CGQ39_19915 (plasmid) [Clostridium botulinum]|uniref:DUF2213 domain-containing protein n=1 Tax=Clostridium botulinum TaxID=1491 RepID=UPI002206EDBE|nr:DUF2213 domain-containing protein [Clostridium botulinum]QDY23181.1 hypothetical protein CGQ39_19915 [Clostridium botulinum]